MKHLLLSLSILFLVPFAQAEVRYLQMGPGKVMAYEWVGTNITRPTLMLLPGVNRALSATDHGVQLLLQQGWNVLLPSLPSHPLSIQGLKANELPYFTFQSHIRAQDYAKDIETLVDTLQVPMIIPISLSYSSSVSAYLNPQKFPRVIDTVPLVIATETNPEIAAQAKRYEDLAMLNPFLGPIWVRSFRDQAYQAHWSPKVDANLAADSTFYGDKPRVSDIKNGYVSIARAVEDFDFSKKDFNEDDQWRDFVFAGREEPLRLKNQVQVLKNYLASGKPCRIVVVLKAGHILPTDMPTAYSQILGLLASTQPLQKVQFAIVNNADDARAIQWMGLEALQRWLNSIQ